ncbi:MAG: DUF599 domain-containing protein [Desulfobacterales bacterium]|nr:DUF599 domain-containing protein [Desulfobacterales bacterium]
MSAFSTFGNIFFKFTLFDWIALIIFLSVVFGYRYFLALMLRFRPQKLFLGKLQQYRKAWIEIHTGDQNSIVVVQTMRNTIMSASFMASTSVILIMGALGMLHTLGSSEIQLNSLHVLGTTDPSVEAFKLLLIVLILSYSFFNFTSHIREVNYMSFILNIPKDQLDKIEGKDSTSHLDQMFLTSGIHFSMGIRGYYFLIPLMMWFFSPIFMIIFSLAILYILIQRDLKA